MLRPGLLLWHISDMRARYAAMQYNAMQRNAIQCNAKLRNDLNN